MLRLNAKEADPERPKTNEDLLNTARQLKKEQAEHILQEREQRKKEKEYDQILKEERRYQRIKNITDKIPESVKDTASATYRGAKVVGGFIVKQALKVQARQTPKVRSIGGRIPRSPVSRSVRTLPSSFGSQGKSRIVDINEFGNSLLGGMGPRVSSIRSTPKIHIDNFGESISGGMFSGSKTTKPKKKKSKYVWKKVRRG